MKKVMSSLSFTNLHFETKKAKAFFLYKALFCSLTEFVDSLRKMLCLIERLWLIEKYVVAHWERCCGSLRETLIERDVVAQWGICWVHLGYVIAYWKIYNGSLRKKAHWGGCVGSLRGCCGLSRNIMWLIERYAWWLSKGNGSLAHWKNKSCISHNVPETLQGESSRYRRLDNPMVSSILLFYFYKLSIDGHS